MEHLGDQLNKCKSDKHLYGLLYKIRTNANKEDDIVRLKQFSIFNNNQKYFYKNSGKAHEAQINWKNHFIAPKKSRNAAYFSGK